MSDRLTYWKCPKCHGTGHVFRPWYNKQSGSCFACAGTGNALVDGETEQHKQRLADEATANLSE